MTRHAKIHTILTITFLALAGFLNSTPTFALTYSQDIPVSFTFNSSVVLTLSSADLNIYNLSPGTAADSNIIKVTATSNNATGYVITATVGDNTHSNPSYSNTSLNHIGNTGNTFTSLATNASLASLTTDNTWGYSISDNGSTWSNYSGLPLYTADPGKTLKELNTNGATSFDFKIAAKASSAQPSGEYRNVINFTLTTNAVPATINSLTYMQDFATLSSADKASVLSSMTTGAQYQLKDSRDQKDYYISKLADGNVWMTQNLDFDIVNGGSAINSTNTDVPSNWADAGNLTNTYATNNATWNRYNSQPESYDSGSLYWSGTPNDGATSSSGDAHYHLGNYYNWTAAVAMAGSSSYTTGNVSQSICPAGWTLPKGGSNTSSGSFQYLVSQYGWNDDTYTMEDPYVWGSPLYFPISGDWDGDLGGVGVFDCFWSSTVYGAGSAYGLEGGSNGRVFPDGNGSSGRGVGLPVRCVAR